MNTQEPNEGASDHAQSAPWRQWGVDLEASAVEQMRQACLLPVAARGALMPDAHVGYGLPIGGVLATRRAVIPYAVGVDIACRMRLSVLDLPLSLLDGDAQALRSAIGRETRFGMGAEFRDRDRRDHPVMSADWSVSPVTAKSRDKAWTQLGTSGSGNHFVEFGVFRTEDASLGLPSGAHLALLSHSGSRGTGAAVADHYSKLAMARHPELEAPLKHLAWLSLDEDDGREYWAAMELMGQYAAANHACIHEHIARSLRTEAMLTIENHHNYAWIEEHEGESLVVHRKGATPAGEGVLGIIPGSMATRTFVVRGLGESSSLRSAAHGAGRRMSRTEAKRRFQWPEVKRVLAERSVELMSAGLDEAPMAYKDIESVMQAQADLVRPVGTFEPRLVKMAPAGERPED